MRRRSIGFHVYHPSRQSGYLASKRRRFCFSTRTLSTSVLLCSMGPFALLRLPCSCEPTSHSASQLNQNGLLPDSPYPCDITLPPAKKISAHLAIEKIQFRSQVPADIRIPDFNFTPVRKNRFSTRSMRLDGSPFAPSVLVSNPSIQKRPSPRPKRDTAVQTLTSHDNPAMASVLTTDPLLKIGEAPLRATLATSSSPLLPHDQPCPENTRSSEPVLKSHNPPVAPATGEAFSRSPERSEPLNSRLTELSPHAPSKGEQSAGPKQEQRLRASSPEDPSSEPRMDETSPVMGTLKKKPEVSKQMDSSLTPGTPEHSTFLGSSKESFLAIVTTCAALSAVVVGGVIGAYCISRRKTRYKTFHRQLLETDHSNNDGFPNMTSDLPSPEDPGSGKHTGYSTCHNCSAASAPLLQSGWVSRDAFEKVFTDTQTEWQLQALRAPANTNSLEDASRSIGDAK